MESTDSWDHQRIIILGAARQGTALARYLVQRGSNVVISDLRKREELGGSIQALSDLDEHTQSRIEWVCGSHPLSLLEDADMLCISGGVPLEQPIVSEALRMGIPLSNDSQIFLEAAPCKVIGITGSAGKTTTTSLVGLMSQAAVGKPPFGVSAQAYIGGNIGSPLISVLDQMKTEDLAVMELSSFQLELMAQSPQVAAILNITPNHLDRHGSMQAYTAAKKRILDFQTRDDFAVIGRDNAGAWGVRDAVSGSLIVFSAKGDKEYPGVYLEDNEIILWDGKMEHELMPRSSVHLRGEHNLQNVLAACAIAYAAGIPHEAMRAGVDGFTGIPHRLEFVRSWGGADWYNDSIATAPERSIAAIRAFDEPLVLMAGGRDKDLPWDEFASIVRDRVDHLILFGEVAEKIIESLGKDYPEAVCSGLKEAVEVAAQVVQPGDVVLLSPGGTSFDEFRDFEERGECFRQLVMKL